MSQRDAYAILGISRASGPDEIKKAYRAKALKYHPDKVPDEDRGAATARFQEIQSAFEQICKGDRRLNWDLGPISKSELVRACEGGDFSTVKILLEESVDLNGPDSTGRTPLMFASGSGHLEADVGEKDTTLGHQTSLGTSSGCDDAKLCGAHVRDVCSWWCAQGQQPAECPD